MYFYNFHFDTWKLVIFIKNMLKYYNKIGEKRVLCLLSIFGVSSG